MPNYKDLFQLDPEVIFLNHGSFGACPKEVFEVYQEWQRRLERQPVLHLGREITGLMETARARLGEFLGVDGDSLVYFPNPTTAINMVARNILAVEESSTGFNLRAGDEILTSDHEYGAMDRTWDYVCRRRGARYVHHPIPLPLVGNPTDFVDSFWAGVTPHTRIIFLSHITSPTAVIFPLAEICRRARQAGILTIIDGAHAPGQIPLNLGELGADIYTGACHKWLMAPKGSAFLVAGKEVQPWLDPLVVSWGYAPEPGYGSGKPWVDAHEWQGTRDMSAFLSVPAAIDFQQKYDWQTVRLHCHELAVETRRKINQITGFPALTPESRGWFSQMFAVKLPDKTDVRGLKERLYQKYHIEIPLIEWQQMKLMRISIQGYNDQADADELLKAISAEIDAN